jgi:6,7-dimethyl-8-ribityllumazine synthase
MSDFTATLKNITHINPNIRIALVIWEFNATYTTQLERETRVFFQAHGFVCVESYWVPWAFEIPAFAKKLVETNTFDLIITLWVVIRGDTPHFDYVCTEASRGIMDLTLSQKTPIIFGVLTCNTEAQVQARIGWWFALAGLNLLAELAKIG